MRNESQIDMYAKDTTSQCALFSNSFMCGVIRTTFE